MRGQQILCRFLCSVFCDLFSVGSGCNMGARVQGLGFWVQGRVLGRGVLGRGYMPKPKFSGKTEVLGGDYNGRTRHGRIAGRIAGSHGVAGPPPPK